MTFKLGKTEMSTKILTVCFKKQSSVSKIQRLGNFEVPSGPNQKYSPLFTSLSFLSNIIFWWQTELSVAVIYHRLGLHYNFLWNGITPCEDLFCSVEWKTIKHSFLHNFVLKYFSLANICSSLTKKSKTKNLAHLHKNVNT